MKGSNNRIPFYSSPDILYNGVATGLLDGPSASSSFNAGRINETGCIVSDFTPSNSVSSFIQVSEDNYLLNLEAIVAPSNPLYKYRWEWSLDGLFTDFYPGQQLGLGNEDEPFLITEQPIQAPCEVYFIKKTISLNDIVVATEIISKKGDICTDNVQDCDEENTLGLIQNQDQNNIFELERNSKTSNTDILKVEEYYLFDVYGRLILNSRSSLEIENELKRLPVRIYFLSKKLKDGKIKSEKIFNKNFK